MNVTTARLTPALRAVSSKLMKRPLFVLQNSATFQRTFSSFGEESPLESFLDPAAPTPLYNSTEFQPRPAGKRLECGVEESALRFKTTCYGRLLLAPFVHPNEHKIVMTVPIDELNLNGLERDILKEIVGSRWREEEGELRLQSVSFGSRIENKRHLVSMLDRLVLSCQRLAAEVQERAASAEEAA